MCIMPAHREEQMLFLGCIGFISAGTYAQLVHHNVVFTWTHNAPGPYMHIHIQTPRWCFGNFTWTTLYMFHTHVKYENDYHMKFALRGASSSVQVFDLHILSVCARIQRHGLSEFVPMCQLVRYGILCPEPDECSGATWISIAASRVHIGLLWI